jgi:hypothetical protein
LTGDLPVKVPVRVPTPIAVDSILSDDGTLPVFDTGNLDVNPTADDADLNTPNHIPCTGQFVLTAKEPDLNMDRIFLNAQDVSFKALGVVFNARRFTMSVQNLIVQAPGFKLSARRLVLKAINLYLKARDLP